MPNKENYGMPPEPKVTTGPLQSKTNTKITLATVKPSLNKYIFQVPARDPTMSPGGPPEDERTELLGSLTTEQQQRTSARVIKKLRLESPADKREIIECETPNKIDDKDPLKFPTVKQRMPKALWSADEKNLFFEALNEYGKDFDAITAYICGKMKKKGMPDGILKTKTQVSHFYYRTWHKLSKHVQFDENVKKVAQELYALINYGELRRKLASVSEKTCARLGEMVRGGSMAVRARGRTMRVRTPMCRALRRLNQITERACGTRVCSRAQVVLRARNTCAWARVQAAAHNPRAAVALPLRTRLAAFIRALEKRWKSSNYKKHVTQNGIDKEALNPEEFEMHGSKGDELESHLNLETDRIITQERTKPTKLVLHLGPRPGAEIHLPVLSPSEQLSSQKICFSSYLERMGSLHRDKDSVKIRTPKRQRKDSTSEKDKDDKKTKLDDPESNKLINIDETAIDGIELMAHFKNIHDDEEKPSTEDEKDLKSEETAEEDGERDPERDNIISERDNAASERDNVMSEREKDSFSEMEDEEKYNKSDTDNESDGKTDKDSKFKNLKVKFRIRPKKRGGSVYTLVLEKDSNDEAKSEDAKVEEHKSEEDVKPVIDVEAALKQIRAGWAEHDAADLTIGDLYLMFGSRSKLELDYWWAEATPPLPQPIRSLKSSESDKLDKDRLLDKREKGNKTPEKGDSSVEEERERSDTDIFSPKNTFSQDSNDGMSGDERKPGEAPASPEHKTGALKLVSKLINRPPTHPPPDGFAQLSDRLKRLLALAGNSHVGAVTNATVSKCSCGHICPKKQKPQAYPTQIPQFGTKLNEGSVFRHPTPIAPRPNHDCLSRGQVNLDDLPRLKKRGRPRLERASRVVVQRLLPLLPKLPPPSNLIPVKLVPSSGAGAGTGTGAGTGAGAGPGGARLLPRPPPTSTADLSAYYVLSESNGQFFFHDGDRRIPINQPDDDDDNDEATPEGELELNIKSEPSSQSADTLKLKQESNSEPGQVGKSEPTDITGFLPSDSMSLSPSRLLRDAEGWLEGSVQDFSLSSFLNQLEGRPHPELTVDSQLQSLMAESSVDYVAKFADLAAEVTDQPDLNNEMA
ncbi:protein cramped isoform X1 [Zerene cesonia]|uniref:protein cramped isoform X1 n=1 Tax=Zerene cesonia TaxID=33412 RepID=UPI0018E56363|nr:protein cramped isoform X1 [Zerene cesonia]XP_038218922.1 protein cramped isoform X1 [Zerene cesonia]